MNSLSQYVGLEFGPINCWSLVTLVFDKELNIELPSYDTKPSDVRKVNKAISEGQNDEIWKEVLHPEKYDIAVMRNPRTNRIGHVGIMTSKSTLLHIEVRSHSVIVPISHFSIRDRVAGFRRHVCLF